MDVFTRDACAGNGLAVFPEAADLSTRQMQSIATELRQVESIFLEPRPGVRRAAARIFTPEEELPFAGHPSLGAAAVLQFERGDTDGPWELELAGRIVPLTVRRAGAHFEAGMAQGAASFGPPLEPSSVRELFAGFGLTEADADPGLPVQVVSTGLPYLMLPVAGALARARPARPDLGQVVRAHGAAFAYLVDPASREARSWDHQGAVEDPATGSAAGPAAAWLVHHGRATAGEPMVLQQGLRIGRPSRIGVTVTREGGGLEVSIEGGVVLVGEGWLHRLPAP